MLKASRKALLNATGSGTVNHNSIARGLKQACISCRNGFHDVTSTGLNHECAGDGRENEIDGMRLVSFAL
jgi:hypothetical protein